MRFAIGVVQHLKTAIDLIAALIGQGARADQFVLVKLKALAEEIVGTDSVEMEILAELRDVVLLVPCRPQCGLDNSYRDKSSPGYVTNWFNLLARHNPESNRVLSQDCLQNGKVLLILHHTSTEQQELAYNLFMLSHVIDRFQLVEVNSNKYSKTTDGLLDKL
jgi:hypothetical protein